MKRKSPKWTKAHRERYEYTIRRRRFPRPPDSPDTGLTPPPPPQPDVIYVLLNGRLQPFVLRTMPVYIPQES